MTTGERMRLRRKQLGISAEEIAVRLNCSPATVYRYEKGDIEKVPGQILETLAAILHTTPAYLMGWEDEQGLRPYAPTHRIPILGRISAGLPLYAEQNIEGYMLTELNSGGEYFALRVAGDSMTAARIYDGDILVIRRQEQVENGQIAVVLVDGEDATVKKFYRTETTVSLAPHSLNPEHQLQIYDATKVEIKVLGLVVQNVINM